MSSGRRPPRLAHWLLARLLPQNVRRSILEELRARMGDGRGRSWYWKQAWLALWPVLAYRIRHARTGPRLPRLAKYPDRASAIGSAQRDVRHALRQLQRHPGFAATVIITLALGIGVNTTIFSVVDTVLVRRLPYPDPDRLFVITRESSASGETGGFVSGPDYVEMLAEVDAFEAAGTFSETTIGPLTDVSPPLHVKHARVSSNMFDVLSVSPEIGRTFVAADGVPVDPDLGPDQRPPYPTVLSHSLWVQAFGADPSIVGKVIHAWSQRHLVVGVMPASFRLLAPAALNIGTGIDIWTVWGDDHETDRREAAWYRVIGRLRDGVSLATAQQQLDAFSARLQQREALHAGVGTTFRITSLHRSITGHVASTLIAFLGAVAFVLLIACANVSSLLLARSTERRTEIAVRAALGAGRRRIFRQLLTESAVLSVLGGALGVLLAAAALRLLRSYGVDILPRAEEVALDARVLTVTVAVALLASILAGALPAWQAARGGIARRLSHRGTATATRRAQATLILVEMAMSMVLLAGAGLMIRTFIELNRVPLGIAPEGIVTVTATQPGTNTLAERQVVESSVLEAVRALPGVQKVGLVFPVPMNGVYERAAEVAHEGREHEAGAWRSVYFRSISPSYFDTVDLTLRVGRNFDWNDETDASRVAIVDERLAAREWPDRSPFGERVTVRNMRPEQRTYQVIGVVEYAPQWDHRDQQPTLYVPRAQYLSAEMTLVVRGPDAPEILGGSVVAAIRSISADIPADIVAMETLIDEALDGTRFVLVLMSAFSGLALALTAFGLYAVLSFAVRRQRREIGIRMACGAPADAIVVAIAARGVRLALAGVAVGLGLAISLGRLLESQLFGVSASDPIALTATGILLVAVAAAASWVPAHRAARIDPVAILQED